MELSGLAPSPCFLPLCARGKCCKIEARFTNPTGWIRFGNPIGSARRGVGNSVEFRSFWGEESTDDMWETRRVHLNVSLPRDVAKKAEAVQESDPEFLSRVLVSGLTRRSIYEYLREHEESLSRSGDGDAR